MKRKEIFILLILITVFLVINVVSYVRRENLKKSYVILVEEEAIQISINEADVDELTELPGIGPVLARRIIEYRNQNGLLEKLEDLKRVKGVGDNLYQKILPYIKL
jgi:competence ComEA-like helix-hairpin-helix protein